jgi:sarcosine oxidase subunit beta
MATTADLVIIGAGVHGSSLAYHAAKRGVRSLTIERKTVASGATGASAGLIRMHSDLPLHSELAWKSFRYFQDWKQVVGGDCGFVRTGFLLLVAEELGEHLRRNVEVQQQLGIPTLLVKREDVQRLVPQLVAEDVDVAAFEPESGYADPTTTATSFMTAARDAGAELWQGVSVEEVVIERGAVSGVRTSAGNISTRMVVLAAGAWSKSLAATIGVELPLRTWVHDMAFVVRPAGFGHFPAVIDLGRGVYARPEGQNLALIGLKDGSPIVDSPEAVVRGAPNFTEQVVERVSQRFPTIAEGLLQSSLVGIDGITPDQHPILGAAGPTGFYVACGFSGSGFKTAPAIGDAMSRIVLDGPTAAPEISAFGYERFKNGTELEGPFPYPPDWH